MTGVTQVAITLIVDGTTETEASVHRDATKLLHIASTRFAMSHMVY